MIDQELLEILACPACKAPVRLAPSPVRPPKADSAGRPAGPEAGDGVEGDRIICTNAACGLRYPVRDGIPVMLVEEAEKPPARS